MYRSANAAAAYTANSVTTASPARLLVMLMERLVLDIERGSKALASSDWPTARDNLIHAQDIVVELEVSLDVDAMPAGKELLSLYEFLRGRLVEANIKRDLIAARQGLDLAKQLADMWREAAMTAAAP